MLYVLWNNIMNKKSKFFSMIMHDTLMLVLKSNFEENQKKIKTVNVFLSKCINEEK